MRDSFYYHCSRLCRWTGSRLRGCSLSQSAIFDAPLKQFSQNSIYLKKITIFGTLSRCQPYFSPQNPILATNLNSVSLCIFSEVAKHCSCRRCIEQRNLLVRKPLQKFLRSERWPENIPLILRLTKHCLKGIWGKSTVFGVLEIKDRGLPVILGKGSDIRPLKLTFLKEWWTFRFGFFGLHSNSIL